MAGIWGRHPRLEEGTISIVRGTIPNGRVFVSAFTLVGGLDYGVEKIPNVSDEVIIEKLRTFIE